MSHTLNIPPSSASLKRSSRFATVEEFLAEYDKGSSLPIDLDSRIDFTKPVYEQVVALRDQDNPTIEHTAKRKRLTR